jgi:uncharacterized protein YhjY with autotransporter beta-barrel domain
MTQTVTSTIGAPGAQTVTVTRTAAAQTVTTTAEAQTVTRTETKAQTITSTITNTVKEGDIPESLVEAAKKEGKVIWFAPHDAPDVHSVIWPRFQEIYPWAEVEFTEGFGALRERFIQEAKAGVPTADLMAMGPVQLKIFTDADIIAKNQLENP